MLNKTIPILTAAAVTLSLMSPVSVTATDMDVTVNNQFWWPDKLSLEPLRDHDPASNPYGADFDYAAEFSKVDYAALKADIEKTLTESKDWWPADWGSLWWSSHSCCLALVRYLSHD